MWRGGSHGEPELLASCHRRSLEVADRLGCRTVSFPAISTGVYGYPVADAAQIALSTVSGVVDAGSGVERVRFCLFGDEALRAFEDALAAL